jgi:probable HAF family extracellular repeat protein
VNNLGDVVGAATTTAGATHAFMYRNGRMLDLGTLPGGTSSHATAINDRGDVAGYGGINTYGPNFHEFDQGFVWQNGAMRSTAALYCPCTFNVRYGTARRWRSATQVWSWAIRKRIARRSAARSSGRTTCCAYSRST